MTPSTALRRLVATGIALAILATLWRYRPAWPDLPNSPSAPLTTELLRQLAVIAVWILASLLTLLSLVQQFGRENRRLPQPSTTRLGVAGRRLATARAVRPLTVRLGEEPRLLVLAPQADPQPSRETIDASLPTSEATSRPRISLLGPLTVEGGKRSRRGLRARALELVALLALRPEGAQRDEILEAIWPGEDPKRSRHSLYQAVRDARRLLGDAIASQRDRYWLDRNHADVDLDQLEHLLAMAKGVEPDRQHALSERALQLYRGKPLAGADYAWLHTEEPRLTATYVDLLSRVGRRRLHDDEARAALELAERGLNLDTLNEPLWRLAIEAEGALGLRDAIAERYERLQALLDERLGLEPSRETRQLYLRLLSQE